MEYQFIPLEALKDENDEDWDADESDEEEGNDEQREVLERIIYADTPDDDLYQKAEEIRPMFRVSPDDFDPNSDRNAKSKKDTFIRCAFFMRFARLHGRCAAMRS